MKNTSRDWIQAAAARSGIGRDDAADPVAAPPKRASAACLRFAICASSAGECAYMRLRSSTQAAAAGAWRSAAASAMYSGARAGSARRRSHNERRQLALPGVLPLELGEPRHASESTQPPSLVPWEHESQVVDADRGLHRDVHVAARHHDRECRAAGHPARPARQLRRAAVGRRRLRADARGAAADRRLARRPLGPPRCLRDRHRLFTVASLLCGLAPHADRPQLLARAAGDRRRVHVLDRRWR